MTMGILYHIALFLFFAANQSMHAFGGDSAEFALVAKTGSIAHPPGYPFYSILAVVINRVLPVWTTPWRVALLSSASTALAAYLIHRFLKDMKFPNIVSLLSGTLYAFLFPVWLYSEIPEVFALNSVLVLAVTLFLFRFVRTRRMSYLYASSFLTGISVSHHHIFILFIPAWAYLLCANRKLLPRKPKQIAALFAPMGIGILFYLYPFIAGRFNPPLDWENASTFPGLLRLILRMTYGTFKAYAGSSGNILNQFFDVFSFLVFIIHDFRIIGLAFIILGLFAMRKNRTLLIFIGILIGSHLFFLFYTNFVLSGSFTLAMYERFLIPIYLILTIPFAFGARMFYEHAKAVIPRVLSNSLLRSIALVSVIVFLWGYLSIIAVQNYRLISRVRSMDYFERYAKDLLDTVPQGGIFFVGTDNSYFPTAYLRFGEGYRKDIKFVFVNILDKPHYRAALKNKYPGLYVPDDYRKGRDLLEFIRRNIRYGVYFENPLVSTSWKPYGLLWKYYETEAAAATDSARLVAENKRLWDTVYRIPELDREDRKILHLNVVQGHYLDSLLNYGKLLFSTNRMGEAENVIRKVAQGYGGSDPSKRLILVNILVYQKKCAQAGKVMESLPLDTLVRDPGLVPSIHDYYEACDKTNPQKVLVDRELENLKRSKSLLKEF